MQVHDSTLVAFATDCNSVCSCSDCYDKKMSKVRELTQLDLFRIKRLGDLIALPRFGGNKSEFAKSAGYRDSSMVGQLLSGNRLISEKTIIKWTESGLCPQGWFNNESSNVTEGPRVRGVVPLINSVQAGNYVCFVDNHHPGDGGMEMIVTSAPVGRHTYALKVSGDSMEPEFTDGQILIIEPELEPMPGDFVIARLVDGEETTFKQLVKDGPEWFLKPLNDRYPIRPLGNATIVGVLRAVEKRYR